MYYVFSHAKGRTDLTAKLHLVELPMFVFSHLAFRFIRAGAAWHGLTIFLTQ